MKPSDGAEPTTRSCALAGSRGATLAALVLVVGAGVAATGLAGAGAHTADPGRALAEFARRRSACPAESAALIRLADFAVASGLSAQADETLRTALEIEPHHAGAYEALVALTAERDLERDSIAYRTSRDALPETFLEHETRRFVVLSDASPAWTRAQAERLERTWHQFERFTSRLGLAPLPLRHKLVCVLFRERLGYRGFAERHDHVTDGWIAGYYSPQNDRIVFYQGDSNPSVVEARERLREMEESLDAMAREEDSALSRGRRRQAAILQEQRSHYETQWQRERLRVDAFADQVSTATTVHEAIHQLMFHTGVQSRSVQYPIWLSEGLATAFETDETGSAFGPDHDYPPRRAEFDRLLGENALVPLRTLVIMTRAMGSERAVSAVYHQSYALVTWMSRFRRDELRAYLVQMRLDRGVLDDERHIARFEAAFGDVDRLEKAWLRHERARISER